MGCSYKQCLRYSVNSSFAIGSFWCNRGNSRNRRLDRPKTIQQLYQPASWQHEHDTDSSCKDPAHPHLVDLTLNKKLSSPFRTSHKNLPPNSPPSPCNVSLLCTCSHVDRVCLTALSRQMQTRTNRNTEEDDYVFYLFLQKQKFAQRDHLYK